MAEHKLMYYGEAYDIEYVMQCKICGRIKRVRGV